MTGTQADRQRERKWLQALLWVFCLAFAFDFRASVDGDTGGSAVQYLFLLAALASGALIAAIGHRDLLKKPGVFLLAAWSGYLAYALGVAMLNGVPLGRFVRVVIPFALLGLGMMVAHVCGCRRIGAGQIVLPVVVAAATNIVWRVFYGFAFKGVTISTVRIEILSPALNWSFAYLGVCLLLAPKFRRSALVVALAAFGCTFLSVTRALIFPMLASALMCWACLFLGIRWRQFGWSWIPKKLVPIGGMVLVVAGAITAFSLVQPTMLERWTERLFDQSNGQSESDPSLLTRQAEAVAMLDILSAEPTGFIYGKGVGGSYYWDDAYYPELWQVYPSDFDFSGEFWFAGHSVWTWALFSGGVVGTLFYVALFAGVMALGLGSVRANAHFPGPDNFLGFLPFVAAWCILSESFTSNPFDERLAGLIFGLMAGLPQALFTRARDLRALRSAARPRPARAASPPTSYHHPLPQT